VRELGVAITVRVLGDLSRFITAETTEMEGAQWSVGSALDEFVRRNPGLGDAMFDAQGRLHYAIFLRTGGRPVAWPQGRDQVIDDGGELLLTRFHSGG
jgi:hypothetical protein